MKIKSWNGHAINDGTNYRAAIQFSWGLPNLEPQMATRSNAAAVIGNVVFSQRILPPIEIQILNIGSLAALRLQLHQWFDSKDRTPYLLKVTDDDGTNERYLSAICVGLIQKGGSGGISFLAGLAQDGLADKHYRLRGTTPVVDTWNITASDQTHVITVTGEDEVYPILTIKPTGAKSGSSNPYKRWLPVRWNSTTGGVNYPMDVVNAGLDTAALVTGSKMQADGDDLRVEVNGLEVNRWLVNMNTSATSVWVNLTFAAKVELTLKTAVAGAGDVDTLEFNEATTNLPTSGILMIGSEAFTYTGKSDALKRVSGVTRSVKGTSAAAHSIGDTTWWVQNDVWLTYGNLSSSAPTVDDNYKPILNLSTSTNTSWVYAEFGEDDGLRTAAWVSYIITQNSIAYGGYRGNNTTNPWTYLGLQGNPYANYLNSNMYRYVFNPCGITNANFTNGEKAFSSTSAVWGAYIYSGTTSPLQRVEYTIAAPTLALTWQSWSQSVALTTGSRYVAINLQIGELTTRYGNVEVADVTLTLDSSSTPTITIGAEQGSYSLSCTITNQTTGEILGVTFVMDLNESLEVDTDLKKVTYLKNKTNQFQARSLVGGVRDAWLKLRVGNNTLKFTDIGTTAVTLTTTYEKRYYA